MQERRCVPPARKLAARTGWRIKCLYGEMRGIVGSSLPEVPALELEAIAAPLPSPQAGHLVE